MGCFICAKKGKGKWMAATKLIALHHIKTKSVAECLKRCIDYVRDSRKTEDEKYVSTYGCDPNTILGEFLLSRRTYEDNVRKPHKNDVIAYQIRQAFKPGEITPEQANEIGYELAMRFTKGKHAFIVTTHTDKHHIHNHVIFNSVSIDGKSRFRNFYFSGLALGRLSDMLCLENDLSVIRSRYEERMNTKNEKRSRHHISDSSLSFLVDIEKKMQEGKGKGYENWARKFNLKQRAKVLLFLEEHGIASYEELVKKTDAMEAEIDALNEKIKARNERMAKNKELQNAIITYSKTAEVYTAYRKSGYSKRYLAEHETEIRAHQQAKKIFNRVSGGKIPKLKELRAEYGELIAANRPDFQQYVQLRKEKKDYLVARKNLELLLTEKEAEEREKVKAKPNRSSRSEASL